MEDYNLYKGLVTRFLDPNNFWMRIGTEAELRMFQEYQQRLDAFYNTDLTKFTCDPDQMHCGYPVVVSGRKVRGGGYHWERAQVTRVNSENMSVDVFFVDLAYASIVDVDTCRAITPDLFNFLPAQANRVHLGGIRPLSGTWTNEATSLIKNKIDGQEVLTLFMSYDQERMSCAVVIYTRQNDGSWRSLIHDLQDRNLALSTGVTIQEVFTNDFVDQCLQRIEEQNKQYKEAELHVGGEENEEISMVDMEDVVEKWDDSDVEGESGACLAKLLKESQSDAGNCNEKPPCSTIAPPAQAQAVSDENKRVVTGFDLRTLMKTRSLSLTQMQREKVVKNQEMTKTNIERDLQRMDSYASSQPDIDQDWDTVQDTDYHGDIVSQIHQGMPRRQYSSDDAMDDLWDNSKLHELALPQKKPEALVSVLKSSTSNTLVEEDLGGRYYHQYHPSEDYHHSFKQEQVEEASGFDGRAPDLYESDGSDGIGPANDYPLSEEHRYRLEKEIKEILINTENLDSDVVCASIYGVVEPDVDAHIDYLCVLVCAILEHVLSDISQSSDIAFAILESYSDAKMFGQAMLDVIKELENRLVKKHQSPRLRTKHTDFARLLALVFKQSQDWEESCKDVQEWAVAMTEKWIIFNKQRHLNGKDLVQSEIIYLEAANTFLSECHDFLWVQYPKNLSAMIEDIKDKLLQDQTVRSVRTLLLDMLLKFIPDRGLCDDGLTQTPTHSQGTQAESMEDIAPKPSRILMDVGGGGDCLSSSDIKDKTTRAKGLDPLVAEFTPSNPNLFSKSSGLTDNMPSQPKWDDMPQHIRNLPPRLAKKYQQDRGISKSQSVPAPICVTSDITDVVNDGDEVFNTTGPFSMTEEFSDLSVNGNDNVVCDQNGDGDFDESKEMKDKSNGNQNDFQEVSPSCDYERKEAIAVLANQGKMSPPQTHSIHLPQATVSQSTSPSPKTVADQALPSPQTFQSVYGVNEGNACQDFVEGKSESLVKSMTNVPSPYSPENEKERKLDSNLNKEQEWRETAVAGKVQTDEKKDDIKEVYDDKTIRYTLQQLRDLNPFKGQPKLPLWDLWEPKDVLEKMIRKLKEPEEDIVLKTSGSWRSSRNRREDRNQFGSSVDPSPGPTNRNPSHSNENDSVGGSSKQTGSACYEDDGNVYLNVGSGLHGIASDVFKSSDDKANEEGESWTDGGEMWHDMTGDAGEVGELLKPKKQTVLKAKKVKKRGREIPLDQFLQEQAELKKVEEEVCMDSRGDGGADDDNEFSEESLKMYEELEQQGVGVDDGPMGDLDSGLAGTTLKFGSSSSTSKRPSIFSSFRTEQPSASKATIPWAPSNKLFCTRCKAKDHTVYSCTQFNSRML